MPRELLEQLARRTAFLQRLPCKQVSLGTRDLLIVDFGTQERLKSGEYRGSAWLVLDCPWRLDTGDEVVIGWEDDPDDVVEAATMMIDRSVEQVFIQRPGYDLALSFSRDLILRVFPDCRAFFSDELAGDTTPWYLGGDATPDPGQHTRFILPA